MLSTSLGSTGMTMPSAMTSSRTMVKMNASAALRGSGGGSAFCIGVVRSRKLEFPARASAGCSGYIGSSGIMTRGIMGSGHAHDQQRRHGHNHGHHDGAHGHGHV